MEELMYKDLATNNLILDPPLPEPEVTAIVKSVWGYKISGNLIPSGKQFAAITVDEFSLLKDQPKALMLLCFLKQNHEGLRAEFCMAADALAERLDWHRDTVRDARRALVQCGILKVLYQGGKYRGDASLYHFNSC